MPDSDDIQSQLQLLKTHRTTLAHYLEQRAMHSAAYAPPSITQGIIQSRSEIRRIKAILREWGVSVDDMPNDEEHTNLSDNQKILNKTDLDRFGMLTKKERAILELLIQGKRHKEIAEILSVSTSTISNYVASIYHKLGAKNRTDLTLIATKKTGA